MGSDELSLRFEIEASEFDQFMAFCREEKIELLKLPPVYRLAVEHAAVRMGWIIASSHPLKVGLLPMDWEKSRQKDWGKWLFTVSATKA